MPQRLPTSDFTIETLRSLPEGSCIRFYETSRSRIWKQAWRIDADHKLAVWPHIDHFMGYFDIDTFAIPTLKHIVNPPLDNGTPWFKPLLETRIDLPGEWF